MWKFVGGKKLSFKKISYFKIVTIIIVSHLSTAGDSSSQKELSLLPIMGKKKKEM